MFVMVTGCVLFDVRTDFLNIIYTSLPELSPVVDAAKILAFPINNSKFRCLSYHRNVFAFTLFLSEGRAGVAWEPSNKAMLFLHFRKH
jgi:hypothetical protein